MADSLEDRVLAELLALRKTTNGVTVDSIARASTITALLGDGDPYVAYTRLMHQVLDSDLDRPVQAAAASLGFNAEGATHLERLDDFGAEVFLDQRQVRRHSDKGMRTLARLIATNWPLETVPQLTGHVVSTGDGVEIQVVTKRLLVVEMREPVITLFVGDESEVVAVDWAAREIDGWEHSHMAAPIHIAATTETSLAIVWRGELWPKFNVTWQPQQRAVISESLGNKLMLRF